MLTESCEPQAVSTVAVPLRFAYTKRKECICGESLDESNRVVEKNLPGGKVRFIRCSRCGSWIQSPQITLATLASWYDSDDYAHSTQGAYLDYSAEESQRRIEAQSRYANDFAPLLNSSSKVLEVGCATGSLLSVLRDAGHNVIGVDISSSFAAAARQLYDLDVVIGDFLEFDAPQDSMDLIIMLGTISNLPNLAMALQHARKLLKPTGRLFFNLPIADSPVVSCYGSNHWMFTTSVMQFMTNRGLRMVLTRAEFRVDSVTADQQRPAFGKLLGHTRLAGLYPLVRRLNLHQIALPISWPIPGVKAVWTRPLFSQ